MTILVAGATGTVGRRLVARLQEAGSDFVVLSRQPTTQPDGPYVRVADLADQVSMDDACLGIDTLFLLTPVIGTGETALGINAIRAAKRAGVRRIVYLGIYRLQDWLEIPHFATKLPIVDALQESGLSSAVLEPTNFFQNDLLFLPWLASVGLYAQPIGNRGISAVNADDIAIAAANLLKDPTATGRFPLVGPEPITGVDAARHWATALGQRIEYVGDDLLSWALLMKGRLPEPLITDLTMMYRRFQEEGWIASAQDLQCTADLLGRDPSAYSAFVHQNSSAVVRPT